MSSIKRTSPQGGCSPLIPGAPVTYRLDNPRLFVKAVAVWLADDGVVIKRFLMGMVLLRIRETLWPRKKQG